MAIVILHRFVYMCLQTLALAADKQYSGWRSSKMSVLLRIRNSQDALHAGGRVLFPCKFTANFDDSRSGAFHLSATGHTWVSVSMPPWKVNTNIPEGDASQKGFLLEDVISKPAPFFFGSSKLHR